MYNRAKMGMEGCICYISLYHTLARIPSTVYHRANVIYQPNLVRVIMQAYSSDSPVVGHGQYPLYSLLTGFRHVPVFGMPQAPVPKRYFLQVCPITLSAFLNLRSTRVIAEARLP